MPNIILIETSQTTCSVGLSASNSTDSIFKTETTPMQHTTQLAPMLQQVLAYTTSRQMNIDAIAVSGGPGSYTGLRIGVSTAKGLAYSLGIPLIAIDTLKIMAYTMLQQLTENTGNTYLCPMIDARRMEVYMAIYDTNLNIIENPQAKIITPQTLDHITNQNIYIGGSGASKCKDIITRANTIRLDNINPTTREMETIAQSMYAQKLFVDVAYYEPFYLKEFQATTPKHKIL